MGDSCCALTCKIFRFIGYLCLNKCARLRRRGTVCKSLVKQSDLPPVLSQISGKSVRNITSRILSESGNMAFIIAIRVEWDDSTVDEFAMKTMDFNRSELLILAFHPRRTELAPIIRQIITGCHDSECAAYDFLKRHQDLKIPTVYFTQLARDAAPGMIIMENLSPRADTQSALQGLNLQQMLNVADALARIHLICLKDDSWRSVAANEEQIKRVFQTIYGGMATSVTLTKSVREFRTLDLGKTVEFYSSDKYMEALYCHRGKLPDVLVHGDMQPNNIMFEINKDGADGKAKVGSNVAAIIDWQLSRPGNPLDDLAKLMSCGARVDVYEHHKDTILRRYYDTMVAEESEKFLATYEELSSIWLDTIAAHSLALPVIAMFSTKFQRTTATNSTEDKANLFRKALIGFEFATKRLYT